MKDVSVEVANEERVGERKVGDVVIYGGGIAGALLARQLSATAKVILVDPLDYFEVSMAAPRNLVKPDFSRQSIMPFAKALPRVDHVAARLTELTSEGGIVEDASGRRLLVTGKAAVLATGNRFANELVRGQEGSGADRHAFYQRFHDRLAGAERILLIGGGPIGVEVAGEITEAWPHKHVTLVESQPRILRGTSEAAAARAAAILEMRGVTILTGQRIDGLLSNLQDVFAGSGEVTTNAGQVIAYDLAILCIGGRPNTAFMKQNFASRLTPDGHVKVAADLRVKGERSIFALGDITDLAENKMAFHIRGHVKVAATNIRSILAGKSPSLSYKPRTGDPTMVVTLGSRTGVAHLPLFGHTRWSWLVRKVKAEHMLVPNYAKIFSL
ncbi:NAD(P)/FAD-dependent oxidoreductase [Mesorhizobium carmichaelinearum]|uniref:NAD(P)/FAD-dependent oxidoreductase n=1 Tax=Mesorhizobium carmichaelinearum TaxID=1208188 RepID=UPI000BA35D4E|nr:FAD-dependent oxidoreductase [Mesorhizobium carmichaelinearum]